MEGGLVPDYIAAIKSIKKRMKNEEKPKEEPLMLHNGIQVKADYNLITAMNVRSQMAQNMLTTGLTIEDKVEGVRISFEEFISLVRIASQVPLLEHRIKTLEKQLNNKSWELAASEDRAV